MRLVTKSGENTRHGFVIRQDWPRWGWMVKTGEAKTRTILYRRRWFHPFYIYRSWRWGSLQAPWFLLSPGRFTPNTHRTSIGDKKRRGAVSGPASVIHLRTSWASSTRTTPWRRETRKRALSVVRQRQHHSKACRAWMGFGPMSELEGQGRSLSTVKLGQSRGGWKKKVSRLAL